MTDWSTLKVVDLRAELSSRGLPTKGVKADLIQRLDEADHAEAPATEANAAVDEADRATDDAPTQEEASAESVNTEPTLATAETTTATVNEDVKPQPEAVISPEPTATEAGNARPETSDQRHLPTPLPSSDVAAEVQKRKRRSSTPPPSAKRARQEQERQAEQREDLVDFDTGDLSSSPHNRPQNGVAKEEDLSKTTNRENDAQRPAESTANIGRHLLELTGEGAYAKREAIAESPEVLLPPVLQTQHVALGTGGHESGVKRVGTAEPNKDEPLVPAIQAQAAPLDVSGEEAFKKRVAIGRTSEAPQTTFEQQEPPYEKVGSDAPQSTEFAMEMELGQGAENGASMPSTHPPTNSLYIRELMRPLKSEMVEQFIVDLITPAGSEPDPSLIEEFYLDQIRTHAFVQLISVAAAQRVRGALHNQVWPNERNRKPLWVDFIPPSQVKAWIEREESASRDRRRWEVAYEQDGGSVVAIHREVGSDSTSFSKPPPTGPAAGPVYPGIEAAPRGPRGRSGRLPLGNSGGIQTQQTRAQPSLFYSPLSEDVARRRIDNMRSFYARDTPPDLGKDYHRFTFESTDSFVDRGREVFIGIRPPHRQKEHEERLQRERLGTAGANNVGDSRRDDFRAPPRPAVTDEDRFSRYGGGRRSDWPPRNRGFRGDRGPGYFREDPYRYRPGY